jgi:hypothetical protein
MVQEDANAAMLTKGVPVSRCYSPPEARCFLHLGCRLVWSVLTAALEREIRNNHRLIQF